MDWNHDRGAKLGNLKNVLLNDLVILVSAQKLVGPSSAWLGTFSARFGSIGKFQLELITTIHQISHLPKVLVLASSGQTDEEEFQNFILNCDPYYKRHLQKLPESKHKSSAPEIEEELKTAFELYSNVCESFFNYFFFR